MGLATFGAAVPLTVRSRVCLIRVTVWFHSGAFRSRFWVSEVRGNFFLIDEKI